MKLTEEESVRLKIAALEDSNAKLQVELFKSVAQNKLNELTSIMVEKQTITLGILKELCEIREIDPEKHGVDPEFKELMEVKNVQVQE